MNYRGKMGRSSIANLHVSDTVKEGIKREDEIKTELRKLGPLRDSSTPEDRKDKIDGHYTITLAVVNKFPVTQEDLGQETTGQIKDREGLYQDILFEVRSDRYSKGSPGRDQKTKAKYLFCRPCGDEIHCARVDNLKVLGNTMMEQHAETMSTDKTHVEYSSEYPAIGPNRNQKGVELRRHYDTRDHYWKVLLFVPGRILSQL